MFIDLSLNELKARVLRSIVYCSYVAIPTYCISYIKGIIEANDISNSEFKSDVIAISKDLRYELYKMDNIVVGSRLFLCLLKKEQIIYILKNISYTKEYVSEVLKTWKDMYNIFGIHKELEELLDQLNIEYQSEYKTLRKIL